MMATVRHVTPISGRLIFVEQRVHPSAFRMVTRVLREWRIHLYCVFCVLACEACRYYGKDVRG